MDRELPEEPGPGSETSDLGPESPALVNLLVNRFEVGRAAVPATLVDLAARRVLALEAVGPEQVVVRVRARTDGQPPLTIYEQQVLDAVRAALALPSLIPDSEARTFLMSREQCSPVCRSC
ncbi:MAG: hypothetical protein ACXW2Y_08530 [Acidimicrobiia bacterium]